MIRPRSRSKDPELRQKTGEITGDAYTSKSQELHVQIWSTRTGEP